MAVLKHIALPMSAKAEEKPSAISVRLPAA